MQQGLAGLPVTWLHRLAATLSEPICAYNLRATCKLLYQVRCTCNSWSSSNVQHACCSAVHQPSYSCALLRRWLKTPSGVTLMLPGASLMSQLTGAVILAFPPWGK